MIQPKIGKQPKLLVVFSEPQHEEWQYNNICSFAGASQLVKGFMKAGINADDISICCLSDDTTGKAAGFKEKEAATKELVDTLSPNMLLIPSAKSFERCHDMKGASKFYSRVMLCEKYGVKSITLPPYSILSYKPEMKDIIEQSLRIVKEEMEYPALVEKEKAKKNYFHIDTISKFKAFFEYYLKNVFRFAVDLETTSLQFNLAEVLSLQFSHRKNWGYFISSPTYGGNWTEEEWAYIISCVKVLIEDDTREKIGANIYYDLKVLHHSYGIKLVRKNVTDILIQSFLVDENRESHSLKFCAATLLEDAGDYDAPLELFKAKYCKEHKIKKKDFNYKFIPQNIMFPYGCMDVDYSLQLADLFEEKLVEEDQVEVFADVSSYAWALARIECYGWKVDISEAERYKQELEDRIKLLSLELQELPEIKIAVKVLTKLKLDKENEKRKNKITELKKPLEFLVGSVNHKRTLFKDILRFREVKKTKKKMYSTDAECFAVWAEENPEVKSIQIIKRIEESKKMLSTYVMAIINRNVNSRIHCSFRVCGAKTGRISSTQPNMQNIAQHSEEAAKLKKCFIAEEGHSLVVADLSNAELRITAALSKDPVLCAGFRAGLDPHSNTAKEIFNPACEVGEVKSKYPELRQLAKTLGFAALYGAKCTLIAKKAGISNNEAQQHLNDYFERHAGIKDMLDANIVFAREHGYSVAISGRKRRVPYINSEDEYLRERAERQSNNFVVQSVASDGMLQSVVSMLLEIDERQLPYKIINIIHDSCEMEVPDQFIEEALEFIVRHLSKFPKNVTADFPMLADAEVGKNWASLKKESELNDFLEEILALDGDSKEDDETDDEDEEDIAA